MSKINLKNVTVCENVIVSFDNKVSLINIFSEISAPNFPAINPKFSVLVLIEGELGNYPETVEILDPEGKPIISANGSAEIKGSGGNNFIANFINVQFPSEGKYWVKVTVDGNVITNKINHFILVKKV